MNAQRHPRHEQISRPNAGPPAAAIASLTICSRNSGAEIARASAIAPRRSPNAIAARACNARNVSEGAWANAASASNSARS